MCGKTFLESLKKTDASLDTFGNFLYTYNIEYI